MAGAVEVEPTILYGVRLTGPVGRFPIGQFHAVRLIARTEPNAGKILGKQLATAVGLPYEEGDTLY